MLIRIRFCLFLSILFSFLTGHAGEHFRLYSNKPQVQAELVEIENRIPLVVRQTIARPIKIKFKELDKNSKIYFGCERELKNIETSIAARVNTLFKIQDISEIEVHTGYLHELQKNPHRQVCGASVSTHFARAVTHEIIHIFDASISPSADEIKYTKRYCVRRGPQGRSSSQTQTGLCKNIKRKWRYSNSVRFLNLDNWSTTRSTKNVLQQNALDPYVFTSARESFAVQAEAFLYDPTFACHKPGMSSYYSEIFNVEPLGGH
ncbi:MAG: hypothetical protein KDD38_09805, partial [Bdellovibrionales bacterium]|nr:hypothetical protein [Bdellovibrionales bacterium]